MHKLNKKQFEVLIKPSKDIGLWYWDKREGDCAEYCSNNPLTIVRHENGYLCATKWNKKIGNIVDSIMRMYNKECSSKFPGKITILPTDYHVLDKSDSHAITAYVIIEM